MVTIYTDGSCLGNPGPGGWGFIVVEEDEDTYVCGGERDTTNNRMELMAVIQALIYENEIDAFVIYTDSLYVIKGITKWIENWKKRGWKKVKNIDLWKKLDDLISRKKIDWRYVKAHNGDFYNEKADELAKSEAKKFLN